MQGKILALKLPGFFGCPNLRWWCIEFSAIKYLISARIFQVLQNSISKAKGL